MKVSSSILFLFLFSPFPQRGGGGGGGGRKNIKRVAWYGIEPADAHSVNTPYFLSKIITNQPTNIDVLSCSVAKLIVCSFLAGS